MTTELTEISFSAKAGPKQITWECSVLIEEGIAQKPTEQILWSVTVQMSTSTNKHGIFMSAYIPYSCTERYFIFSYVYI